MVTLFSKAWQHGNWHGGLGVCNHTGTDMDWWKIARVQRALSSSLAVLNSFSHVLRCRWSVNTSSAPTPNHTTPPVSASDTNTHAPQAQTATACMLLSFSTPFPNSWQHPVFHAIHSCLIGPSSVMHVFTQAFISRHWRKLSFTLSVVLLPCQLRHPLHPSAEEQRSGLQSGQVVSLLQCSHRETTVHTHTYGEIIADNYTDGQVIGL